MGGRSSSSGLASSTLVSSASSAGLTPDVILQPQPDVQQQPPQPGTDAMGFSSTDAAPYHDLYGGQQYFMRQNFGIDTQMAIMDYLHDQATPNSMYSPSQNLNYAMRQGLPLTANQQYMVDSLMDGMHNIGYNINLTRYDRVDFLQGLLGRSHVGMSEAQLQRALIGKVYPDPAFVSASYNDFKNAPPSAQATFKDKAVEIRIKTPASAQGLMPGNGPGGRLGEIILAPNQNYKVVDVKAPAGVTGRSGPSRYQKVIITVEIV